MQALLKKYAGVLFAAALLVIGGVAGWKAWIWYQDRRDFAAAASYLSASNISETAGATGPTQPAAIAAFQVVAADAPNGYRILARLREAAIRANTGDLQ